MDAQSARGRCRKLATLALLVCASLLSALRAEELRCERIMLGACQKNLLYEMTIASAPETAMDYLTPGGMQPAATAAGAAASAANATASGIVRTWLDVERLITSLRPVVVEYGCSKHALFLFCSTLFPLCSPEAPRPVHPCRSLCEQVRKDCFGEPPNSKLWPAYLDCRMLPQPEKHELCMDAPPDATGTGEKQPAPAVTGGVASASVASTLDLAVGKGWSIANLTSLLQHPGAGGGVGIKPGSSVSQHGGAGASWSERIRSILLPEAGGFKVAVHGNRSGATGLAAARPSAHPPAGPCPVNYSLAYDRCVPRCGPTVDALYSARQKELIESWTLVLSAGCFIFTFTSLVTFWTRTGTLEYPDRPILFITLCYNLLGLCYLERTILHSPRRPDELARADCSITSQCLAYYILKHYLLLSASTWWLIYGLCWYLSTAKQWSCEALERKSGLFHVLAWVVPFAAPIGALLRGHIQRFELTGFCTARGFTELPTLLLLLLGAALVCAALAALARLRICWNQRAPHLSRVFGRVLTFAVCYLLPALAATVCMMLERVEHELEPHVAHAHQHPHFSLLPTALRLALTLLGGGSVGVWLWSHQTTTDAAGKSSTAAPPSTGGYYAARDFTLFAKGGARSAATGHLTPATGAADGRPASATAGDSRLGAVEAAFPDGSLLGLAGQQQSKAPAGDTGGTRGGRAARAAAAAAAAAASASPYRTSSSTGGSKAQKYFYVYRPCSTGAPENATANSLRSSSGRRSLGPDLATSGTGVHMYRSLRPVPVSMITRI